MDLKECMKGLKNPENLHEQVDSVCFYLLTYDDAVRGKAHYEALKSLPDRVKAAALDCFLRGDAQSYHASVLRHALKRYKEEGWLDSTLPIC